MAKSSIVLALLVVAVAAVHSAHGLFFHVTEGAQRCFIEEVCVCACGCMSLVWLLFAAMLTLICCYPPPLVHLGARGCDGVEHLQLSRRGSFHRPRHTHDGTCKLLQQSNAHVPSRLTRCHPHAQGLKVLVTSPSGSVVLTRDLDSEVLCSSLHCALWLMLVCFAIAQRFLLFLRRLVCVDPSPGPVCIHFRRRWRACDLLQHKLYTLVRHAAQVCTFLDEEGPQQLLAVQQPKLTCLTLGLSQRLDLEINVGEMAIDYNEVAKKEHLTGVEISIRKLNDKIRDIMKEQAYQRVSLSPQPNL